LKTKIIIVLLIVVAVTQLGKNWNKPAPLESEVPGQILVDRLISWRIVKGNGAKCTQSLSDNPGGLSYIYDDFPDDSPEPFYSIVGTPEPGMNRTGRGIATDANNEKFTVWWYAWDGVLFVEISRDHENIPVAKYKSRLIKSGENLHLIAAYGRYIVSEMCFLAGESRWVGQYIPRTDYSP